MGSDKEALSGSNCAGLEMLGIIEGGGPVESDCFEGDLSFIGH